ncbi:MULTISPECIES: universal stress protein [Micromonospora]|uniref:Universal stress protein n=1 Tax=Micromonospora solifontis TaxID=2487138 RepID=A0ABX9WJZ3_9ACTN|nr:MULTISPECIES: universal stress protein [Micromonospora]NES13544.1 universal stress protein [Micromonospora sp. PPF5-17B]NES35668.1 universal stress protein [Micromonospora solifontis]NES58281.1 universal stress protein [Micromonospora sp. PPF5-6]RNM00547.1 universal stress protein [Micromonospora solifontis]
MTDRAGAPVVVGVDGSASALAAVRMAAREAAARHRPLRVVNAFLWPLLGTPLGPVAVALPDEEVRQEAGKLVAEAVDEAHKVDAELEVTGAVVDGGPVAVLLRESRDAALIVLGHRGLGGFAELLVGSAAVHLSARADCPVLVVRDEPRADGPVVVGVDGSALSDEAVGFAFAEAAQRGTELVAVRAWLYPAAVGAREAYGDIMPLVYDPEKLRADEERGLAEALAGWAERYPEVPVRRKLVAANPARALVEESTDAQLTVVGAHGRGSLGALLLGSVSHAVLHHCRSPLAIVRHHKGRAAA